MNIVIEGKYAIINGTAIPAASIGPSPDSSSRIIYEVVRVMSGVPLFLENHMNRLEASSNIMGCSTKNISDKLRNSMTELIKINDSPDKNVRISVYNMDKPIPDYMEYFVRSSYPAPEDYKRGVHAILFNEERDNPNAKVVNASLGERVSAALADAGAYETLLVNKKGEITEGSRSNIFFAKNGRVITAPKANVLMGITRTYIFELCRSLGIEIIEKPTPVSVLGDMEGVFMTGTSPKILPISSINDMSFNSAENPVIKALMKAYDEMVAEYVKSNLHAKSC